VIVVDFGRRGVCQSTETTENFCFLDNSRMAVSEVTD
jgi:hypothetical protein